MVGCERKVRFIQRRSDGSYRGIKRRRLELRASGAVSLRGSTFELPAFSAASPAPLYSPHGSLM